MVDAFALATFRGQFGGTAPQWEAIVTSIKKYVGADLTRVLKEYGKATRASAQMMVGWGNKGYAMIFHFLAAIQDPDDTEASSNIFKGGGRRGQDSRGFKKGPGQAPKKGI